MTEPDPKTTLREFKEYVDQSCELSGEIAARVGVAQKTIWDWLSDKSQPKAKSLAKLRRFLDNEAKRPAQGDGIRPVETVPYKIIRPLQQVRYARLCRFYPKSVRQLAPPAGEPSPRDEFKKRLLLFFAVCWLKGWKCRHKSFNRIGYVASIHGATHHARAKDAICFRLLAPFCEKSIRIREYGLCELIHVPIVRRKRLKHLRII